MDPIYKITNYHECVACCRTPEILNQLREYFISLKAIPVQVLLTGYNAFYLVLQFTLIVYLNDMIMCFSYFIQSLFTNWTRFYFGRTRISRGVS